MLALLSFYSFGLTFYVLKECLSVPITDEYEKYFGFNAFKVKTILKKSKFMLCLYLKSPISNFVTCQKSAQNFGALTFCT